MPRILIIEDEPDIVRGLELNLRAEGYDVVSASTGPEGLQAALRDAPDLVLLDIMLPGMSGLDVCRELRVRHFDRPIIMLTARSAEVDRVVGLEIGADDRKRHGITLAQTGGRNAAALTRSFQRVIQRRE